MNPCELCETLGGELLWRDDFCRVVLVNDLDYPGFCRVILNAHVKEMTDLTEAVLRTTLTRGKINLASRDTAPVRAQVIHFSGTLAVSRPDISTQIRFHKEEKTRKVAGELRAEPGEATPVKILTSCPSCLQGLSRYDDDAAASADTSWWKWPNTSWGQTGWRITSAKPQTEASSVYCYNRVMAGPGIFPGQSINGLPDS